MTASTPPRTYLRMRYTSTTPSAPYTSVSVVNDVHTSTVDNCDTAREVNIHTPSPRVGLGTTTNGCLPISVKIQPVLFAMNGVAIPSNASRGNHLVEGSRPVGGSQHARTPNP